VLADPSISQDPRFITQVGKGSGSKVLFPNVMIKAKANQLREKDA
jgi:hypothetical protein